MLIKPLVAAAAAVAMSAPVPGASRVGQERRPGPWGFRRWFRVARSGRNSRLGRLQGQRSAGAADISCGRRRGNQASAGSATGSHYSGRPQLRRGGHHGSGQCAECRRPRLHRRLHSRPGGECVRHALSGTHLPTTTCSPPRTTSSTSTRPPSPRISPPTSRPPRRTLWPIPR